MTIFAVLLSFLCSCVVFYDVLEGNTFNGPLYTWLTLGETFTWLKIAGAAVSSAA